MIIDTYTIRQDRDLQKIVKDIEDSTLIRKIKFIEKAIRKHTNNKFLDTKFRVVGDINSNKIMLKNIEFFKEGDSIELSHSFNNGVFTVTEINEKKLRLDIELFNCKNVMVTKVVYPEDIQEGVLNLLKWDFGLRNKVGIKSETISRQIGRAHV